MGTAPVRGTADGESSQDELDDRELAHVAGTYLDQLEKQLKSEVTRNESYYDDADRDLRCHILERFKRVADLTSASWDEASRACEVRSIQRLTVTARQVLHYGCSLGVIAVVPEPRAPKRELVVAEQRHRRAMTEK